MKVQTELKTWKWRKEYGRLRIGYILYRAWFMYGASKLGWCFTFRYSPVRDHLYNGLTVGGYFQVTLFGLQIAYCFRKDFKEIFKT